MLVSGDRPGLVLIAHRRGISSRTDNVRIGWAAAALQKQGRIVAMIEDGVNDAPVLAAAQVSLAMGGGTPLAMPRPAFVLLSVSRLKVSIKRGRPGPQNPDGHARNFAWAIGYNLIALPLAAGGWLTPWMSALRMCSVRCWWWSTRCGSGQVW